MYLEGLRFRVEGSGTKVYRAWDVSGAWIEGCGLGGVQVCEPAA